MFDYLTAVEVSRPTAPPKGFSALELPQRQYAVFTHAEHIASVRKTFAAIWDHWLPASGFSAVEAPFFELYGANFDPLTGNGGLELWIPIQTEAD